MIVERQANSKKFSRLGCNKADAIAASGLTQNTTTADVGFGLLGNAVKDFGLCFP